MTALVVERSRGPWIAAGAGFLWGLAGYALLWGHTAVVVHHRFVVSLLGTALLLPVRLVLWGIHAVEGSLVSGPFDFATNNGWIGVLAGLVGAGLVLAAFLTVRAGIRLGRRRTARRSASAVSSRGR